MSTDVRPDESEPPPGDAAGSDSSLDAAVTPIVPELSADDLLEWPIETLIPDPKDTLTGAEHHWAELACGAYVYVKPDRTKGGSVAHKERAAWLVLQALGWTHLSSPVVVRLVDLDESSEAVLCIVQEFQDDLDPTTSVQDHNPVDTARAAAFDYLIKEGDRHRGNFGRSENHDLYLFDHGMSFAPPLAPAKSVFVNRWRNRRLPKEVLAELREAQNVNWDDVVQGLVSAPSVRRMVQRLDAVCTDGILRP